MLIFLTISFLLVGAAAVALTRAFGLRVALIWSAALAAAAAAWISTFFWQLSLPSQFSLGQWQPATLFTYSPAFLLDGISWLLALSLTTLALGIILTAPARSDRISPVALAGTLMLTAFGLAAVLSANPLTLLLAWTAIDLVELITLLRTFRSPQQSERAVVAFAFRAAGSGLVMWASTLAFAAGTRLEFASIIPQSGIYLLLGAGLRLGVLPLHLPYSEEPVLRRGFGTTLRLVSAASSVVLLARIPPEATPSRLTPFLLLLAGIVGLLAGWRWLRAKNELGGRPYWIIGMASLAVMSALTGNPIGSAGWGAALVLSGGAIFIYSIRSRWLGAVMLAALLPFSALPFSLTGTAWQAGPGGPGWVLLLGLPLQILLAAGFIRHIFRQREPNPELPTRLHPMYPFGILALLASGLLAGLWGWEGARQVGVWWVGLAAAALSAGLGTLLIRLGILPDQAGPRLEGAGPGLGTRLGAFGWWLYRLLGAGGGLMSDTLEGDGGTLWTVLLLVLLITLLQGGA